MSLGGRMMHDFNDVFNESSIIEAIITSRILLLHGINSSV